MFEICTTIANPCIRPQLHPPCNRPVGQHNDQSVTLPAESNRPTGLSQIWTSQLYMMTNRLCRKCYSTVGNFCRPVCNCSQQACKASRPVCNFNRLGCRVGKICNQQALNGYRQAINNNPQACNTNRQAGNCNRQANNIFSSFGLSVSKSVGIKR